MDIKMSKVTLAILAIVLSLLLVSCGGDKPTSSTQNQETLTSNAKIGVLVVSHGSHSKQWRKTLLDVGESAKPALVKGGKVADVRTAYMEYEGPSIADQLRAFDEEGYSEVIIVPMFLTVSSHTADDIQNIVGIQSNPEVLATLKEEEIQVYSPKAKVRITPLLDFPGYLKKNVTRRYKAISKNPGNEGVVLVAYGSEPYNQQWVELINDIGKYLKINAEVENISYSWCGHIVRYAREPTTNAINQILEMEQSAVVIPILVAVDEHFQGEIVLEGVQAVPNYEEKVIYKQDAILPDDNINQWVVDIVNETIGG
ncbi:MAG: cobalamin biosynthesis protein CbiX [Aureispira sp.]|nr:cobalamin biosynthesis protein CbiX [Aureispira sp.]